MRAPTGRPSIKRGYPLGAGNSTTWRFANALARALASRAAALLLAPLFASHSQPASPRRIPDDSVRPAGQDEQYRRIVESSPDAILIYQERRIAYANPASLALFGARSAEPLLGAPFFDRVHPAQRASVERELDRVAAEATTGELALTCLRLDGSALAADVRAARVDWCGAAAIELVLRDATDRRRAEEALRESENKFRALAESLPLAIGIYQDDRFVYVNPAGQKMSGYSEQELLAMHFWEIAHPDSQPVLRERGRARQQGEMLPTRYDVKLMTRSREERWMEIGLGVIEYGGRPAVLASGVDITERKRGERLQGAVYQIAQAVDQVSSLDELYGRIHGIIGGVMPAGNFYIALYDREQNLVSFPYFVDEIDVPSPPSPPGHGVTEYVLRTGRSLLLTPGTDARLKAAGEIQDVGVPSPIWLGIPLRDGEETIGVMAVQHYSDPLAYGEREQQMLEFVSAQVAQAINRKAAMLARERAESALSESESRYRNLFENAPVGIYRSTPDGRILAANPALVRMLGYNSFDELSAVNLDEDGREFGLRDAPFKQAMEEQGYIRGRETAWRKRGGELIYIRENAQVTRAADGSVLYYDGTVEDITERKRVEIENARLLGETRRRADEFALLYETARELSTPQSQALQLQAIVERARLLLHTPFAFVYLYDRAADELELTVEKGMDLPEGIRLKAGEGGAGRVAITRQPLVIENYRTWSTRSARYEGKSFGPALEVPMLSGGELIGVLGVGDHSTSERLFSQEDTQLLSLFAGQAAAAMRGARLIAETERRAREFAALYETAQELSSMQDLRTILDLVLSRATALLSAPAAFIYLYDPGRDDIELTVEKGELVEPGVRLRVGEGVAGRVAESRRGIFLNGYEGSELRARKFDSLHLAAIAAVPMLNAGELIGVMGVTELAPSTRRFGPDDVQLLTLFAEEAASAVTNARLLAETRSRAQQLGLLYDAGLTLNSVLEPRAQLEFLFKIAMRALRADRAEFFRYDSATREMVIELGVGYGGEDETPAGVRFRVDEEGGLVGWVYRNRMPLNVPDLPADPRYVVLDPAVRSGLWVPVEHQGEVRGILAVLSTRTYAFSPQDERLLVLFGNQSAVALENARLYTAVRDELAERGRVEAALRDKVRTLQTLAEIDRQVMASQVTQEVMDLVCRRTAELLHAPRVLIAVDGREGLEVIASHGVESPLPEPGARPGIHDWSRLGRAGSASRRQEITANDPRLALLAPGENVQSVAHAMLMGGEVSLGLLVAFDTAPRRWTDDDLELLTLLAGQAAIALDKTRLVQELTDSLSMTTRLYRLTGQVLLAGTVEETARLITETLKEGMAADMTSIRLLNERGDTTFHYEAGLPEGFADRAVPRTDGTTRRVWRSGQPVIIETPSELHPHLVAVGVHSAIALPLPGQQGTLGVLFVDYCQPHEFSEREVRILSLFANQTALALRHARLLEETRQRAEQLALVNQTLAAINQPGSLEEVLTRTLRELGSALNADSGGLAVFGPGPDLALIAEYDSKGGRSQVGRLIPLRDNPSIDYMLRERRPLAIPDASDKSVVGSMAENLAAEGIQSMLLLPLVVEDRLIGTIGLDSKKSRRDFQPDEIALAETLAHSAAAAIEKARLYEETRRRAEQLSVVSRIAAAASQSRGVDALLETVYEELRRTFPVDNFYVALYDEERQELDFRVRVDDGQKLPPELSPLAEAPLSALVLARRKTLLIQDLTAEQENLPAPVFFGDAEQDPRSWVGIPLQIGSKIMGLLSVQSYRPRAYDEAQKLLLETIADQVAVAIENARLFEGG